MQAHTQRTLERSFKGRFMSFEFFLFFSVYEMDIVWHTTVSKSCITHTGIWTEQTTDTKPHLIIPYFIIIHWRTYKITHCIVLAQRTSICFDSFRFSGFFESIWKLDNKQWNLNHHSFKRKLKRKNLLWKMDGFKEKWNKMSIECENWVCA